MKCKHCNKTITLVPSAAERARKYGGTPADYARLFEYHTECALEMQARATAELIRRT